MRIKREKTLSEPSVAIIVLNYNNSQDTQLCVERLRTIQYSNYQTIIVDNHSTDDSLERIKQFLTDETVLTAEVNRGYAAGNNIGIQYALDKQFEYVCILNNDVLVDPNYLQIMVSTMIENPKIGISGPRICEFSDDTILQSAGANTDMRMGRVTQLYKGLSEKVVLGKIINCSYVGGACMVARTSAIKSVGLIPEDYFLFYEENEWCLNFVKQNYEIVCIADAKVTHKGSASINQIGGLSEYFMYRNLIIFMNRNANFSQLLYFYPYIILFCIKAALTKKDGLRYTKYVYDGIFKRNKFANLER